MVVKFSVGSLQINTGPYMCTNSNVTERMKKKSLLISSTLVKELGSIHHNTRALKASGWLNAALIWNLQITHHLLSELMECLNDCSKNHVAVDGKVSKCQELPTVARKTSDECTT